MNNEFGLSENATKQFNDLYCLEGETISDAFNRVASDLCDNDEDKKNIIKLLEMGIWRPNTPVWLNAGSKNKIFAACYVVNMEDSMDSIYDTCNVLRKIFQFGSGVGIPIGNLRESEAFIYEGNMEKIPEGKSSGPVVFMKLFDAVGETTKSGGRVRRAAILCGMPVWHPDIRKFITCKQEDGRLENMNISVTVTDSFMKALSDNISFPVITSYNGSIIGQDSATEIWDLIVESSYMTADPGVIFIDTVNKYNPLVKQFLIEVSNPCLVGNTLVKTNRGDVEIKDIVAGDKVLSYNEKIGKTEWDDVVYSSMTKKNANVIKLELEDGEVLELTPGHKVFTENRGYVEASQLTEDDVLLCMED